MRWLPPMQSIDPLESKTKSARRRFWNIFFGCSFPLLVGLLFLWNYVLTVDRGGAVGGKIENGQFFVIGNSDIFNEVSPLQWSLNITVTCLTFASVLLAMAGITYFFLRYYFIPVIRARNSKKLY
jgi:hypothetical protein